MRIRKKTRRKKDMQTVPVKPRYAGRPMCKRGEVTENERSKRGNRSERKVLIAGLPSLCRKERNSNEVSKSIAEWGQDQ